MAGVSTLRPVKSYYSWNTFSEEVLCLCIFGEQNVLTGHESLIKIWTWDSKLKVSKETAEVEVTGSVTCICQIPHTTTTTLAVSVDKDVLFFCCEVVDDIVVSLSLKDQICFNEDEINQIDIHPTKNIICSCDDKGDIKVIDIDSKKLIRTLTGFHDGICSTVKFCCRKPWELVSGGLDCTIGRWDFNRGRLITHLSTNQDASDTALFINPPMVHTLDTFSTHHSFVCGLGDGRLVVYSLKPPKNIGVLCQAHAHLASIACIRCIEIRTSCNSTDLYIVSVGNEAVMCVHRLKISEIGDQRSREVKGDLILVGKVCCASKVNAVDILYNTSTSVLVFTADVVGSISVFIFELG